MVTVSTNPPSFLYRDGAWVNIHVSCNSACGTVSTQIDGTYGWGFETLDSNGDANNSNTIYIPSSVLTPGRQHTLTVNYPGNSTYAAASGSTNFTILTPGTTPTKTTVSLSSPSFSAAIGAWAYIHVNCTSSCGYADVRIDDVYDWGTVPLDPSGENDGGYTTYIPITYQNPGLHHLTVYYLGNTVYAPSVSQTYDFTILGPSAAGTIYSSSVSYTTSSNVSTYTDSVNGKWTNFSYDAVNRLTAATQEVNKQNQYLCWTYDSFGNRTSQTPSPTTCGSSASTVQYPNNQVPGLGYDASGNVNNDGTNRYLYDAEGRICAVQYPAQIGPPVMAQYIYDAEGQRVAKGTITSWSCDASNNGFNETNGYMIGPEGEQLTEVNGQGDWVHSNVFANGQLIATYDPQDIHFHVSDWLGTRRVQADYAGNIESTYQSLPFGETVPQYQGLGATEHFFTGKERDAESGLDYFKYRYYGSNMGRWMRPDPSGLTHADLGNPQSLNLYSYVGNNPLTRVDLDGLCWKGFQWACDIGQRVKNSVNYGFITDKQVDARVKQGQENLRNHGVSPEGLSRVAIAGAAGKTWQTYIKRHPNLEPYAGRTSGTGTPEQNLLRRDANHQMNEKGFGEAELDKSSSNPDAIRGREQQLIDANGGAQSQGGTSSNVNNGIAESNPNRANYMNAAEAEFGAEEGASTAEGVVTTVEILNEIPD